MNVFKVLGFVAVLLTTGNVFSSTKYRYDCTCIIGRVGCLESIPESRPPEYATLKISISGEGKYEWNFGGWGYSDTGKVDLSFKPQNQTEVQYVRLIENNFFQSVRSKVYILKKMMNGSRTGEALFPMDSEGSSETIRLACKRVL